MNLISNKCFLKAPLFIGCLFILSSFFEPTKLAGTNAEVNLKIAQKDNNILVSVQTIRNSKTQFYMFTIDGELIKEFDINGSKKIIISKLKKGIYLYEFFSNDERLKNGKIELK